MTTGVYAILNIYNEKCYIGSAQNIKARWYDHSRKLNYGTHTNKYLQNSRNKHWNSPFIFTVIEFCELTKLTEREQFWISELKPEYNLRPTAHNQLGFKHSKRNNRKI